MTITRTYYIALFIAPNALLRIYKRIFAMEKPPQSNFSAIISLHNRTDTVSKRTLSRDSLQYSEIEQGFRRRSRHLVHHSPGQFPDGYRLPSCSSSQEGGDHDFEISKRMTSRARWE